MPVRTLYPVSAALCMLCLSGPGAATQLYKWIDQHGVTNYSDQPPAATSVKQRGTIENRVSVYTPDAQLTRAMEAERARALDDLRTGRRSRDIHEEWLARQYFAAVARANPDYGCANAFDPRCASYMPFAYAPGFLASRRPRILPQIELTPGTTAGNVTGSTGFIPGYSAFAPRSTDSVSSGAMMAPGGVASGGARAPRAIR